MFTYPFDFHFTSAIVSRVPASLKDAALCQRDIREVINIDKARKQHQDYIATLRYMILLRNYVNATKKTQNWKSVGIGFFVSFK